GAKLSGNHLRTSSILFSSSGLHPLIRSNLTAPNLKGVMLEAVSRDAPELGFNITMFNLL
ncbi:MAG: hypothetical protein QF412_10240, partial [Planctomycetota bacterium]|nr:hypothetical protein [Planctomycetota bacterium]